eukprot:COSAG01_NODE_6640_length_3566_cov_3.548443_1_plen_211_part_00
MHPPRSRTPLVRYVLQRHADARLTAAGCAASAAGTTYCATASHAAHRGARHAWSRPRNASCFSVSIAAWRHRLLPAHLRPISPGITLASDSISVCPPVRPPVVTAASIETLQERLDGLVVDVRAAQQQSRSAEHAELRSIRAEHEDVSGAAARAEKGLRGVEHRRAELQTQLQQRSSELRRLERQRQQLTEELEMGEASMRHAESGVHGG